MYCPECKKAIDKLPCKYCGYDEFVEKYAKKDDTGER